MCPAACYARVEFSKNANSSFHECVYNTLKMQQPSRTAKAALQHKVPKAVCTG